LEKKDLERFGLHEGQMRGLGHLVHNGGWYNSKGEKIGWGDLDNNDFSRLRDNLPKEEVFYVLTESDSFWNFVEHNPGLTGDFCTTSSNEKNPGLKYVREKAYWAVIYGTIYSVSEYNENGPSEYQGLKFFQVRHVDDIPEFAGQ
jgi:hypothetical protein